MTNSEVCDEFARLIKESPEFAIHAVQQRLMGTDFEIKLLKSDLSGRIFREPHGYQFNGELFPYATAQKGA